MARIEFYGWGAGARKIPFIKLMQEEAGLSLTKAKDLKDRVIDRDEVVIVEVDDDKVENLISTARSYKLECRKV